MMSRFFAKLYDKVSRAAWATAVFIPLTKDISTKGPSALSSIFQNMTNGVPDLSKFLSALFNIAISVGAILAVLRIAYGGFVWMTTEAVGTKTKSREIIQNAVLGLVLLLAVVLILERINPGLLSMNFLLQQASPVPAPAASSLPTASPAGTMVLPTPTTGPNGEQLSP